MVMEHLLPQIQVGNNCISQVDVLPKNRYGLTIYYCNTNKGQIVVEFFMENVLTSVKAFNRGFMLCGS